MYNPAVEVVIRIKLFTEEEMRKRHPGSYNMETWAWQLGESVVRQLTEEKMGNVIEAVDSETVTVESTREFVHTNRYKNV